MISLACGLVLTTSTFAQNAQPLPRNTQPNPYPPPLYQMNDVSKSLNLTPEQTTRLNTLTDQIQTQYRDKYTGLNSLNEADRAARAQELNRQYANDWNKGARGIFNENQLNRYQQLNNQYGGFNTLYDPEVQKRLNLTQDQITNLREQANWNNQQWQEINRLGATDPTKATQMYKDYWTQRQERFNKYLTPQQQRTWNEMIGEPYTFQPTFTRSFNR